MFIEEVLKDLSRSLHDLKSQVEAMSETMHEFIGNTDPEFVTVKQLSEMKDWPYSEQATRKLILRDRLVEGVHYFKVDGKIICKWPACKRYLSKNYTNIRSA